MLLLLASLAYAHIPHDLVLGAAIPPDFDTSVPWFVIQDIEDQNDLYRSDDGGVTWNAINAPPLIDDLSTAAYTTDDIAVLLGEGRYWYTTDGTTWSSVALSFQTTKMVAYGRYLYFVGPGGVYRTLPGGVATSTLSGVGATNVFVASDGVIATISDGSLYRYQRGSWTHVSGRTTTAPRAVTGDSSRIYAGYDDGTLWRYDSRGWTTCGVDPYAAYNLAHNEVVNLATDGSTLLLARADIAAAVSTDRCSSWRESEAPMNIDWPEDPGGSSATVGSAFPTLQVNGSQMFIGSYDGIATYADGEWRHRTLKGGDYSRGIAFSNDFDADGIALVGAYGSGVAQTDDGGATWVAPADGIENPNVENVLIPSDAAGAEVAYALFDRVPHRSDDDGLSWTELTGPFTQVREIAVGTSNRVWALGLDTADSFAGGIVMSNDGGASWREVTTWPAALGAETIRGVIDRYPRIWAWSETTILRSTNGGTSWQVVATADDAIYDLVGMPPERPSEVTWATESGIWLYSRGSTTKVYDDGEAEVIELAIADDGTVVAADQLQRILRSDDASRSWYATGATVTNQVYRLATRPDFATWQQIFAAGSNGAFLIEGADVRRWMAYQRVDDGTDWVECSSCNRVNDPTAALGRYTLLTSGNSIRLDMRGDTFRVIGSTGSRTIGKLYVDGAVAASFNIPITPRGSTIVETTGLSEDWHELEVTLLAGSLALDGFEAEGTSTPAGGWTSGPTAPPDGSWDAAEDDLAEDDADGAVSCSTGGPRGAGWLGILVAGLVAARRSRR